MLDKFGTDLTALAENGELDPVIGRVDEIEQTIEILSRRTKNNPVLIGEAGVGKTAIVEGLARAIVEASVPEQLLDKRVISLDLPGMLAGTRYRGDFEERLTKTMDEIAAHKGELIVFIDEIHTVVGAGGVGRRRHGRGQHPEAAPRARRAAPRGRDHAQGVPHHREGPRARAPVPAGEGRRALDRGRRADPARPASPRTRSTTASSTRMTRCAPSVELSARYLTDRVLPDKAIDLIDQAGARLRLRLGVKVGCLRAHRAARRPRGRQERRRRRRALRGGVAHPRRDREGAGASSTRRPRRAASRHPLTPPSP